MSAKVRGIKLPDEEVECLKVLEQIIGRKLPQVTTVEYSVVGFRVENAHIVGLGLYGCKIQKIPKQLFSLNSLQMLNLWDNQLTNLSSAIGELYSLTYLNLETNQLTMLPDELFSLPSLQKLFLGDNQLTSLPASIGRLKKTLIYLNLNRNCLTELPNELFSLTSLKTLGLSYNLLTELPDAIGQLISLEKLTLEGLSMEKLPQSLKKIPSLKEIYWK